MSYQRWSKMEIQYLVDNFEFKDIDIISEELNRTKDSVYKKAMRLGLTKTVKRWTEDEIEFLIKCWGKYSREKIAQKLNRSSISIKKKAVELKLGPQRISNGDYLTSGDIGYLLNKDPNLIYRWLKSGYIKGRRFGDKKIFQIKPKDFLMFLKNYPNKWDGYKARTDFIKPYFYTSNQCELPSWFIEKVEIDAKNNIKRCII
ncbi:hypothetical protein R9X47_15760 [Wukongibacter baidiensis]|uniref:hypothetical protein n=1 Tax=Wukongibacter baidiensis TaxID=1723361 RepID=UPI003D7F65C9